MSTTGSDVKRASEIIYLEKGYSTVSDGTSVGGAKINSTLRRDRVMYPENPKFLVQAKSNIENASKQVMNLMPKDQPILKPLSVQGDLLDYYSTARTSIDDAASKRDVENALKARFDSFFLPSIASDYVEVNLYSYWSKNNTQQVAEEMLMLNKQFMKRLAEDINGMSVEALKKFTDKRRAAVHVYDLVGNELERLGVKAPEAVRMMYMQALLGKTGGLFNVINEQVELNKDNIANCIRQVAVTKEQTVNIQKTVNLLGNQLENTKNYLENALLGVKGEQKEILENQEVLNQQVSTVQDWLKGEQKAKHEQALLNDTKTILQFFTQLGQATKSPALYKAGVVGVCGVEVYKYCSALKTAVSGAAKVASGVAGTMAVLGPIAGLGMTALSLINLFMNDNNRENEMIYNQLQKIFKEIHGIRYQIHHLDKRLDHVESKIDSVYRIICFGFDAVLRTIISEQDKTRVFLRFSFDQVLEGMRRLHEDLINRTDALLLQPMRENLFEIEKEKEGSQFFQEMSKGKYNKVLSDMEFWMTREDERRVFNGSNYGGFGASEVLPFVTDFANFPENNYFLGRFIGYLANYAKKCGVVLDEKELINPLIWMDNAEQYMKLTSSVLRFHPEWLINAQFDKVIENGEQVLKFIEDIRDNRAFFLQLFDEYETNLRAVYDAIDLTIFEANAQLNDRNKENVKVSVLDDREAVKLTSMAFEGIAPLGFPTHFPPYKQGQHNVPRYSDLDKKFVDEISGIILAERLGVLDITVSVRRDHFISVPTKSPNKIGGFILEITCNGTKLREEIYTHARWICSRKVPGLNFGAENTKALVAIEIKQIEKRKEIALKLLDRTVQPGFSFNTKLHALEKFYMMLRAFLALLGIRPTPDQDDSLLNRDKIINMLRRVGDDSTELCRLQRIITRNMQGEIDLMKVNILEKLHDPAYISPVSLETQLRFLVENLKGHAKYCRLSKENRDALDEAQSNDQTSSTKGSDGSVGTTPVQPQARDNLLRFALQQYLNPDDPYKISNTQIEIINEFIALLKEREKSLPGSKDADEISKTDKRKEVKYGFSQMPPEVDVAWFDDAEINNLLVHFFGNNRDVRLVVGVNIEQGGGATFVENIYAIQLDRVLQESLGARTWNKVIVPINLGNRHWTALYVYFNTANQLKPIVGYFDPFGDPAPDILKNRLRAVYTQLDLNDMLVCPVRLQNDRYNCGPWIIVILEQLVKSNGLELPPEDFDIQRARRNYRMLLSKNAPSLSTSNASISSSSALSDRLASAQHPWFASLSPASITSSVESRPIISSSSSLSKQNKQLACLSIIKVMSVNEKKEFLEKLQTAALSDSPTESLLKTFLQGIELHLIREKYKDITATIDDVMLYAYLQQVIVRILKPEIYKDKNTLRQYFSAVIENPTAHISFLQQFEEDLYNQLKSHHSMKKQF